MLCFASTSQVSLRWAGPPRQRAQVSFFMPHKYFFDRWPLHTVWMCTGTQKLIFISDTNMAQVYRLEEVKQHNIAKGEKKASHQLLIFNSWLLIIMNYSWYTYDWFLCCRPFGWSYTTRSTISQSFWTRWVKFIFLVFKIFYYFLILAMIFKSLL